MEKNKMIKSNLINPKTDTKKEKIQFKVIDKHKYK